MTELLSNVCRWLVEKEDAEAVGGACDSPKSGGLLTNRQPTENLWMLGTLIPHYCVPFTKTHNLTKIEQSLFCTRSSTQNTTCRIYNNMTHLRPNITQ